MVIVLMNWFFAMRSVQRCLERAVEFCACDPFCFNVLIPVSVEIICELKLKMIFPTI